MAQQTSACTAQNDGRVTRRRDLSTADRLLAVVATVVAVLTASSVVLDFPFGRGASAQDPEYSVYVPVAFSWSSRPNATPTGSAQTPTSTSVPPTPTATLTTRGGAPTHADYENCIVVETSYSGRGDVTSTRVTRYNNQGRAYNERFYDGTSPPDGPVAWSAASAYRDGWQILTRHTYNGDIGSRLNSKMWWVYDSRELLTERHLDRNRDGIPDSTDRYLYDADSRLALHDGPSRDTRYEYDEKGRLARVAVDVSQDGIAEFATVYTWRNGLIVSVAFDQDADGVVEFDDEQTYDELGRIVRSRSTLVGEFAYEYGDDSHLPIKVDFYRDDQWEETTEYRYEDGRWLQVEWRNHIGEYELIRFENECQ